tara:strand:+ start:841 stop:1035 length:195 start_codon:yes stop_codon:yes gene_type:complete
MPRREQRENGRGEQRGGATFSWNPTVDSESGVGGWGMGEGGRGDGAGTGEGAGGSDLGTHLRYL